MTTPDTQDTTTSDAPLSMSEAIKAFTAPETPEEADPGQSEEEEAQDEDHAEDEELAAEAGEDEGEPGDEEDQAEATEDDDDSEETEIGQGRFAGDDARVKMTNPDGTTSFVTVAELKAGSLKNADYTQKTQALSAERQAFQSEREQTQRAKAEVAEQREYVISLVKSILPPQPDPSKADPRSPNYDPAAYQAEEVAFRSWATHLTNLETEQQRTAQERQAETVKQTEERIGKEWAKATELMPELKDPKRLEAFGRDTLKYGAMYGYTPQELANVHHDHRQLLVLKKAIAFDKLQAKQANPPALKDNGRPPVLKGGKRLNPGASRARDANAAMDRLEKSGSLRDGVAAYLASQKKG